MANEYYERLSEMNPGDLADGLAMEAEFDAIAQGFSKLPTPHTGGQGFDGPVRVGDAVNDDEAASLGQLNAAIGEAVLLPIATYGNLSAAAWGTLPSNTYLLFGTGAQFSNTPYTLVAGSTYYLQVRHVIGGAGVSIYHDQLSLASTDDSANVDLRRLFVRTGSTFAAANTGGWVGFALKKAALTALESLVPAADQIVYYTSAGAAAMTMLSSFARTLLDDADAAAMRTTMAAAPSGYGIGEQANNIANLTTDPKSKLGGIYRTLAAAAGIPSAVVGAGVVMPMDGSPTVALLHISSPMAVHAGIKFGDAAPSWVKLFHSGNVVGAVGQIGGVPTGGIIEYGSNANGEYVKFADGTMFCSFSLSGSYAVQTAVGALFGESAMRTWTFPAAFAATPQVVGSVGRSTADANTPLLHLGNPSVVSCAYRVLSVASSVSLGVGLAFIARGRWY
ncbi:hypothetical protein ACB274_06370 [Aeromonas sanarellii]